MVTTGGAYVKTETEWTRWFLTTAGLRGDRSRYRVDALDAANSGTSGAGLVSPKLSVAVGPWKGSELYVNAGSGFHSNNAIGTTITRDFRGSVVSRVTPLVRGTGAEVGIRSVSIPHLQTTVSLWMLRLGSELIYNGDIGATEPGPASERHGVEVTNYYSPLRWLVFDGDLSWSQARFTTLDPAGRYVPEAVGLVVSAGASVPTFHNAFGSLRWRYFGPRALVQDNEVRSKATSLVNLQGGYRLSKDLRLTMDLFNVFNARSSDIEYFFASRLPGEPLQGVEDIHFHPVVPRMVRIGLVVGF
jgi:outer membrane receptor protein involved in Fe transport